ncbi:MAG: Ig-like domain-containing protein, partial [Marinifilaceae bacterium]
KITPLDATNKTLVWSSSDELIASVDSKGLVTTKKVGVVTITGISTKDKKTASYTIKVEKKFIQIDRIKFIEDDITIAIGSKCTPIFHVFPQNATEKIVWKSSNSDIASVDDKGVVTAIKVGQVTITGLGEKHNKGGQYIFKVVNKHIPITAINFYESNIKVLGIGFMDYMRHNILPSDATDRRLTWTSSNPDIAVVDEHGLVIGKKPGNVVIKARSLKDNVESSCNIKVENINIRFNFFSSFKILYVGEKFRNGLQIFPYYANTLEMSFSSSNEEVASVNDSGEVTAKKLGKSRITVSYNEFSSYFDVQVVAEAKDKVNIKFIDGIFKNALVRSDHDKDGDGEISEDEAFVASGVSAYNMGVTDITEIKYFKNIEFLYCPKNDIKEVNLEQNTKLTSVNLVSNINLKRLNLLRNTELKNIDLNTSGIESLDLSKNIKLTDLNCKDCKLTALDVSFCVHLKKIDCTGNPGLKEVYVFDKKLADSSSDFKKNASTNWVEKKN